MSLRTSAIESNYCRNVLSGMESLWGPSDTYPAGSHRAKRWKALTARLRDAEESQLVEYLDLTNVARRDTVTS